MNDTTTAAPLRAPLYRDIERRLTDALTHGEWKPGTAIPPERRLAARFGISLGTLRRAVDELVAANILIRQQGRGTFVARHTRDREAFHFLRIVPGQRRARLDDLPLLRGGVRHLGRAHPRAPARHARGRGGRPAPRLSLIHI